MKKRDWTFVTLCLAGAILAAVGSIKVAMGYRAHRAASDFSSSHRPRYPWTGAAYPLLGAFRVWFPSTPWLILWHVPDLGRTITMSPPGTVANIGDENAGRAPANPEGMEQRMHRHRRIQQSETRQIRLAQAAVRLRQQATGTLPRIKRVRLIRRAQQADTASQMNEWLSSPQG